MSLILETPPAASAQKRARTADSPTVLDCLIKPTAFGQLTSALKQLKNNPEAEFPSPEQVIKMDAQIKEQYEKLARVQEHLQQASNGIFELHTDSWTYGERWATVSDPKSGLRFEIDKDVSNKNFYRSALSDVESCFHSIKLFRDHLNFQISLHETMRSVQERRHELAEDRNFTDSDTNSEV
eukprot:3933283-Rhodomonas_salina.1